ncbi:integrase [Alkalibacillus flavidus]|uniref:Integrase n=2 Tax=Alkalibacillus flavidus TaxID=546021 RepID=A0ABV2KVP6_9BACI
MNTVDPIYTQAERKAMKEALAGRDRLLFTLGCSLGLRISDLLRLKVGDIQGQRELVIREEKTKKARRIPISAKVDEQVVALDKPADAYIFSSRKRNADGSERPITRQQAYTILKRAAERAGIDARIGGHTLRKTFGLMHYQNGVNVTRIMRMLNHASPRIKKRMKRLIFNEEAKQYV